MAAYDGSRDRADAQQPYSSSYDQNYDPRAYQHSSFSQGSHYRDEQSPRSRASSNAPSDSLPQPAQPLYNALNNAFDKSDSARAVDPDLIAQITAEVKKSVLDEIKLNGVGVGVAGHPQPPPPQQPYIPQSPTSTSASFPSRNVYTPPSPRHTDYSSHGSASPEPLNRETMFDGADDTPTPRCERSAPVDIPQEQVSRSRPATSRRMPTDGDLSPIEKMWQLLFDADGRPTPRLGQFLRGLALHLIDDYEPKRSLVISPAKMKRFYDDVKLSDEIYPWQKIFGRLPYSTLSKIYREMRCQHHFIQEHPADQPQVPALTPEGFEQWMTAMIQAYPDSEYERLSKAVLDMPISNADNCKERFPKELPRRMFPHRENLPAQQRCAAALSAEGVGPLRKAPTFPPPPPMGPSSSAPPPSLERERSPYSSQTDARVVESENENNAPLSMPIERERKPYSAAPGGGKVHDDDLSRTASMQSDSSSLHEQRKRAQSTASQSQWMPPNGHQHPRTNSTATGRRPRSPSFSNYGTRSDPNVGMPGAYYSSSYDPDDENRRAEARRDWARRSAEEGTSGNHSRRSTTGMSDSSYDSQARSIYDDDRDHYKGRSNGYDNRTYDSRRY
ncbi:hypothetical protein EJ04DRAFT_510194 [Polyplosphaeria fusca]|uniref:DUF7514 domain-containing protein n=1 Tax=Polyplosphaeria fusca TaxID=682080 RepID=A0A9P4V4A7_9PLEO|nr:hypothetical protein EJ04DRAFT_510194 [Polyplosphaeria fusca]